MNKVYFMFYLMAATTLVAAEIDSRIDQVTVYPNMAMVQRQAKVRLEPGENLVELAHLSPMLIDESVFAKLIDAKDAQLQDVNVERWFLEKPEEGIIKKLEDQITEVEKEDKRVENEMKALAAQEKFLTSIQVSMAENASKELMLGKVNAPGWTTTLDYIGTNLGKVYGSISDMEFNRDELKSTKEALQKQLLQVKTAKPKEEKSITLTVHAKNAGSVQLVVAYLVTEVTWWPSYDVRALPADGAVEVVYSGHIRQKTGEEWQGVNLALSTAAPARGAEAPELKPWDLRIYVPRPMVTRAAAPQMMMKASGVAEAALDYAPAPAAEAETKGVSVVFNIAGAKDVPSSEDPTKVLILRQPFKATMSYLTVPKLSPFAYLRGTFTNESAFPLLPGDAMVYVDGDYVGRVHLQNLAPAEEVELSLGIDENIKVERELVKKFERNKGLVNKKTELEYDYKITVENYKSKNVTLQVLDQLPRPLHESISMDEVQLVPEVKEMNKQTNELKWVIDLKPKEKKELTIHFTISYPRDANVSGLE